MNSNPSFVTYISIVLLLTSCGEDMAMVISPTSEFYFIGEIENQVILFEETDSVKFIGGRSHYSKQGLICSGGYKTGLFRVNESGGVSLNLEINFYNVAEKSVDCSQDDINDIFLSQLESGNYPYAFITPGTTTVALRYLGQNETSWSTLHKNQSDENFLTVLNSESIGTDESGKRLQKVEGKFHGYLYQSDLQSGNVVDSIKVQNARFVYKFISE